MKRTLSLRRETLAELATNDLAAVAGGALSGLTCPLTDCLDQHRPSYEYTCLDCLTRSPACY
ncbi:MAG TPA: hypothetical protein VFQ85_14890 [Mycobacteriales bacterium]|jgi:hypothetical protein|nr:hypothetical protein [Mycobacteriales bacterium]